MQTRDIGCVPNELDSLFAFLLCLPSLPSFLSFLLYVPSFTKEGKEGRKGRKEAEISLVKLAVCPPREALEELASLTSSSQGKHIPCFVHHQIVP
jgi:hypothetical protein